MAEIDESKILVAIARLQEKSDHLNDEMGKLSLRLDECVNETRVCTRNNFRYMVSTLIASTAALFGWALFIKGLI